MTDMTLDLEAPGATVAPRNRLPAPGHGSGGFDAGRGDGDGYGGGGGGGGGDAGRPGPDRYQPSPPIGKYAFAMVMFLTMIVMLFAGLIGSYLVHRVQAGDEWPPPGLPPLPSGLWVPTGLVLLSSVTLVLAQLAARRGEVERLAARLGATTLLGLAFVAAQLILWRNVLAQGIGIRRSIYGAWFYVLTGVHGAHMIGGVIFLMVVWARAARGRYTANAHIGVDMAAMYWHFMGVLWLFLFVILYLL